MSDKCPSVRDLELAKFIEDSSGEVAVNVSSTDKVVNFREVISYLSIIADRLEKIELHLALITEEEL